MRLPLLLFIVVPMAELLLLFEVAARIGGIYTLLLVITTAFVGVNVLRLQGFKTWHRANQRMTFGELPGQEIVEGMLLAFAGALLLTPGLITDVIGFSLLTPPLRKRLASRLLRSGSGFFFVGMRGNAFRQRPGAGPDVGGRTMDGDYRREDDAPRRPLDRDGDR
jgi:UPF0716 protein FxsA